jgi:aconitase B
MKYSIASLAIVTFFIIFAIGSSLAENIGFSQVINPLTCQVSSINTGDGINTYIYPNECNNNSVSVYIPFSQKILPKVYPKKDIDISIGKRLPNNITTKANKRNNVKKYNQMPQPKTLVRISKQPKHGLLLGVSAKDISITVLTVGGGMVFIVLLALVL